MKLNVYQSIAVDVSQRYGAYNIQEIQLKSATACLLVCSNITAIINRKIVNTGCMTVMLLSDLQIDVLSYGLLLLEMCNKGARISSPEDVHDKLMKVPNTHLRQLILWCIQTDPEERSSMSDVIREFLLTDTK